MSPYDWPAKRSVVLSMEFPVLLMVIPKRMHITFFKLGKHLGLQNTFSITRGFFLKRSRTITAKIYTISIQIGEKQLASISWSAMASTTTWWRYLKGYVVEFPKSAKYGP